jgi:hypothetical protein
VVDVVGVVTVAVVGAGAVVAGVEGASTVFVAVGVVVVAFVAGTPDFAGGLGSVLRLTVVFLAVPAFLLTRWHFRGAGFRWPFRLRVTQEALRALLLA